MILKKLQEHKYTEYSLKYGMSRMQSRDSDICVVSGGVKVGDTIYIVRRLVSEEITIINITFDGKLQYRGSCGLSFSGNPFGAGNSTETWGGIIFPTMEDAEKYRKRWVAEFGNDDNFRTIPAKQEEWHIT